MSNEFYLGFVAVTEKPLSRGMIQAMVASWLDRFEGLEQIAGNDVATLSIKEPCDIIWEDNLQFRIVHSDQFAWIYLTCDQRIIETTGTPNGEEVSLSLQLLTELPEIKKIIPHNDEKQLSELEEQGLL